MKKLCQIAIYETEELRYLENLNSLILENKPYIIPCTVQCEVLEFNSIEDFNNLANLVSLEAIDVLVSQEDLNQFGSLREAAKSKLIGVE